MTVDVPTIFWTLAAVSGIFYALRFLWDWWADNPAGPMARFIAVGGAVMVTLDALTRIWS